ncbi:MAG: hypothetical protein KKD24_08025 [Proteobacteria bacterium]|nr:hypothetical protein [Pseudomonadota bacterium]
MKQVYLWESEPGTSHGPGDQPFLHEKRFSTPRSRPVLLLLQGHLHIPGARRSRLFPDDRSKEIPSADRRLLQAGKDAP